MVASSEDSARIRKFYARCDMALKGPVFDFRDVETGDAHQIKVVWKFDTTTGKQIGVDLDFGVEHITWDDIDLAITRCRVFILQQEDNYLPGVMNVLMRAVEPGSAAKLRPLKRRVNTLIKDGQIKGAHMYSGRLEEDNGVGPGKLLGNDQIAMDYINGRLAHEDTEAAKRLENVGLSGNLNWGIVTKLNDLMQCAWWVRAQAQLAEKNGWLILQGA